MTLLDGAVGRTAASRRPDGAVTWEVVQAGSFCVARQSREERGGEGKQTE